MELGLNGATTLKADLATDIAVAGKAGFDFVEIWAAKLVGYLDRGGLQALRKDLRRAGVRPATLNSVERITFNDPSGHIRMLEDFQRLCRVAEAIGCETILVVPSPRPKRASIAAIEKESVRVLRTLSQLAQPYGVRLAYEFLGFADCSVNSLTQCAAIVEKVARPNVGLVLDTFHFFAGGSTLASIREVDPRRIFMVHLNDVERVPRRHMHDALRLYPGKGIIPLRSILRELQAICYEGTFSVEIFRPQYWSRAPLQVAREARGTTMALLREADFA
jgi:2-keto-myo-inositol isomerase